ncbi:MAG TPA: hypothetical protein VGZ29_12390 [Terriglobia bacterium]|nr:hypothetical protein [Terriglobia bacterium]
MDFTPDPPVCPTDTARLEDFAAAAEAYLDTAGALQDCSGPEDIQRAYRMSELARLQCVAARKAVERHRQEHGCRTLGVPKTRA